MTSHTSSDCKGRNNLSIVRQYLQNGTFPKDCNKVDRRAVRKRSKTFVYQKEQLYYTGGRPKRSNNAEGEEETAEISEHDGDNNQHLRKCCITEEEKKEAVMKCHIGSDGTHYGMEKTVERLSNEFYWVGIINTVRRVLHNCSTCLARGIRGPSITASTRGSSVGNNNSFATSSYDNGIKEEEELGTEADVFYVSQETTSHFWQKVEIQVFGPYIANRKQVYVAVALDSYSQYPEATIIDSISASSLTNFVLNLICRYGVMEKISLLQNRWTKDIYMYINMQDMELAGIVPAFLSQHANPADERWQRVEKCLERFVKTYPKLWDKCLEAFMVPLRISLPPEAEYVPSYLTFGREINFPDKLSHKTQSTALTELRLTEEDENETVNLLMTAYGLHSKTQSVSVLNPFVNPDAIQSVKCEMPALSTSEDASNISLPSLRNSPAPTSTDGIKKVEKEDTIPVEENAIAANGVSDIDSVVADDFYDGSDVEDEDEKDATYEPGKKSGAVTRSQITSIVTRSSNRKRKPTFKMQAEAKKEKALAPASTITPAPAPEIPEAPVKRKRGRPPKVRPPPQPSSPEDTEESGAGEVDVLNKRNCQVVTSDGLMNSVEQLDLDTYYLIVKRYKERGIYPPQVSVDFKRAIRRLSETVELRDGKLYGHVGKASGRLIITREKERFSVLRKAHVKGEEHVGRVRMLKNLMDMNVFWKGMSLDLDAYIHACPECVSNKPLRDKTVVRIPSKSVELAAECDARIDSDPHLSEDEEEDSSYEDIIQFLIDGTFPNRVLGPLKVLIKQRAKSFCIIDGSLYYKPPSRPDAVPRQVLFAGKSRREAIQKAHMENDRHLNQQDTQVKLRRTYYWSGMTYDIMRFLIGCCCCTAQIQAVPLRHRNNLIQERVEKFHLYYQNGIPDSTYSTYISGTASETARLEAKQETGVNDNHTVNCDKVTSGEAENSVQLETENYLKAEEEASPSIESKASTSAKTDDDVVKIAVAAIIDKMGGMPKKVKIDKGVRQKPKSINFNPRPTPGQVRSRKAKTKHKCDHCSRVIKGEVAFKVHLYKHTGIKPFSCNICGKAFSNRKSQRIHMRKHTGVRPYLCNQCGRDFFRSASLRYHLKAHATGRGTPVSCDVCGRTFTTQHRLNRHKEFKHPLTAKVFMCNQCGKIFTAARSLKRHEQTHTGIKKYQCQYCSKSFYRKEYLNSHLTNHVEYNPDLEKNPPRKRAPRKQQKEQLVAAVILPDNTSGDIQWTDAEQQQAATHISEQQIVTVAESFQHQNLNMQQTHTGAHILTHTQLHSQLNPVVSTPHLTHGVHSIHALPHTRLVSVAGSHGSLALTVSSPVQPIGVLHASQAAEILLQHQPVQYEVECLSGDPSTLTEADLNAIHLLAQASLGGQNIMH